jgi:chromatin remodeling complex protein RSC6
MPVEVSAELKKFLGLGASELISRTSAAGKLTAYAREHKLFDEKNGRLIRPNAALKTLLRLGESDELTIPSLQKFIGVHFPPKKA